MMSIQPMLFMQLLPYLALSILMRFVLSDSQRRLAYFVTVLGVLGGLSFAALLFVNIGLQDLVVHQELASWFTVAGTTITWDIYIDSLSALMLLVVTSVSAVVHLYSFGYMSEDKDFNRFIAYLSLFTFFMLLLVVSKNFLQLFVGWEGVGLCSYLLIGFWYKKEVACVAANKAFIVNRVGDLALILGISALLYFVGSLDFQTIFSQASIIASYRMELFAMQVPLMELICLMLLLGAMGKSAQIGLHVWLPDAMEGPTPVSALIHAATMVTAGVFLIARCSILFEFAMNVKMITMIVGAVTCLFAAVTAIGQNDIKKIIAYSTCSQLGYMFLACGVGAYSAAMFHLFTHAFFKALLFLCAGNIIHAAHHEQDIRKLYIMPKQMPLTYIMMWIGSIALCGIFPLAGYYSKDLILESVYFSSAPMANIMFYVGLLAALFTAAYSAKIIISVFHSPKKIKDASAIHEAGFVMNAPLLLLVLGSLFSGFVAEHYWHIAAPSGYFSTTITNLIQTAHHSFDMVILYGPLVVALCGMILGAVIYKYKLNNSLSRMFGVLSKISENKFYFDEIYDWFFVRGIWLISTIAARFDYYVIDRFGPGGFAKSTDIFSGVIRRLQTGFIFHYAYIMMIGMLMIFWWILSMFYSYS